MKISQISSNYSPHASIVLKWLWSRWLPDEKLTQTLINCWMEIHQFDRSWDILLRKSPSAIEEYLEKLSSYVNKLISDWKTIELFWVSFWWYLALKLAKEMKEKINSVVAIATLLNPYEIISARAIQNPKNDAILDIVTSTWIKMSILKNVVESSKWQEIKEVNQNWLIILWSWIDWKWDWFETIETMNWVKWSNLKKVILKWAIHTNTISNPQTQEELINFYKNLFQ